MLNKPVVPFIYLCCVLFLLAIPHTLLSQEPDKNEVINNEVIGSKSPTKETIDTEAIQLLIFNKINQHLKDKSLNTFRKDTLLELAANDNATYMAYFNKAGLEQETKDRQTTAHRLLFYGASIHGEELVTKNNLSKSGKAYSYDKIADDITFSWFTSSKKATLFEGGKYNLIGISVQADTERKRVYVSTVLGNYKTTNLGTAYKEQLPIPYSEKNYGLMRPIPSVCKKVDRADNLNELYERLVIEDDVVYYETDNIKELTKIIKNSKDGLAVEFLQKEQFNCSTPNIIDHNLPQTGVISKRILKKKLFKKNLADLEENKRAFKGIITTVPEGLSPGYEANLVVIQDKHICRSIPKSFIIQTSGTYTRKVTLLADTVNINSRFDYKPTPDSTQLSMRIPFENNKANYKSADIEPFIKLLNEPAFFIYDIKITAYSSIEGSDKDNKRIQQQRATSILNALKKIQADSIKTEIITDYNRIDFDSDLSGTEYNSLVNMPIEEAQDYIRKNKLKKNLEPILRKHRYAQIDMNVSSDITGENEKPFVLEKFNEAIDAEDRALALSIEKFIIKQITSKRYTKQTISELTIPEEMDYVGLLMNKYWLMYQTEQMNMIEFQDKVELMHQLDPNNEYIAFNRLFLQITNETIEIGNPNVQVQIERLYYTPLQKETVDGLNIKYQFKVISKLDSLDSEPKLKAECIKRIKQIVDIKDETLENSLKLSELFIENKDYPFAIKTLEPWLKDQQADEKLYFTYVSLCSQYDHKMHTERFNYAMNRAQELNPERFCKLFNGEYFSLRVFENQVIKNSYCEHCSGE